MKSRHNGFLAAFCLCIAIAMAGAFAVPAHAQQMTAEIEDTNGEQLLLLLSHNSMLYNRLLNRMTPNVTALGSMGKNIGSYAYAGAQHAAIWLTLRGLSENNARDIDSAIKSQEYAFDHQTPAGNFSNSMGADERHGLSSDIVFIQGFAQIYLLIANSGGNNTAYMQRLEALRPKLSLAMKWLAANAKDLASQDIDTGDRLLSDASAFLLAARILRDPALKAIGEQFVTVALAAQRPDGSFNEMGGTDTSYQGTAILNIGIILLHNDDPKIDARLTKSLGAAMRWLLPRIDSKQGLIDTEDNTRTGRRQDEYMGDHKDVNYPDVAMALLYAATLNHDMKLMTLGERLIEYWMHDN